MIYLLPLIDVYYDVRTGATEILTGFSGKFLGNKIPWSCHANGEKTQFHGDRIEWRSDFFFFWLRYVPYEMALLVVVTGKTI